MQCEDCLDYLAIDDSVILEPDSEIVCQSCFADNHYMCEDCSEPYHKLNVTEHKESGDMLCEECSETRIEDDKQYNFDLESDGESKQTDESLSESQSASQKDLVRFQLPSPSEPGPSQHARTS